MRCTHCRRLVAGAQGAKSIKWPGIAVAFEPTPRSPTAQVQPFDHEEARAWLRHLAALGLVPRSQPQLTGEMLHAWHLTGGSPSEMRMFLAPLFH